VRGANLRFCPAGSWNDRSKLQVSFKTDGLRAGFEVRISGIRSSYATHFTMTSGIIT